MCLNLAKGNSGGGDYNDACSDEASDEAEYAFLSLIRRWFRVHILLKFILESDPLYY